MGGGGRGEREREILSNFHGYDGYCGLCHKRRLLSKERIYSSWSKFVLFLRVNPSLQGLCQLGKQTESHES